MAITIKELEALNISIVDAVAHYAREHYDSGWDFIVEAWTVEDEG